MEIPFSKYHALGNDYLVINPKSAFDPSEKNIRLVCHRNFGVGSDGILYGPLMKADGIHLRIFNPDGSEAEKSGNGIRIFSRYLQDQGYVQEKKFSLHTLGGQVEVEFLPDGLIRVDMGAADFRSDHIPVHGKPREVVKEALMVAGQSYQTTCVSMGNPHCVIPLEDISESLVKKIGPAVENHKMFPKRINLQLLKVLDRKNIQIEIWERGAGYTLASGSSSCAAASVAHKLGFVDPELTVHMPGGKIQIEIKQDGHVHMTGPVTKIANGSIDKNLL